MNSRKYILGLAVIVLVLSINLIFAASDYKVAYIYKSKSDKNIVDLFTSLRLKVEMIKESSLPKDLSEYRLVFIGDENFAKDIPIEKYPIVMMNHYLAKKEGLVGSNGISQLTSNQPLLVNNNGNQIKVYSSSKDNKGVALSYYYLDNDNKPSSLEQFLGTYSTSSGADFGTVSALGTKGDTLSNGVVLEQNLCFFGITRTDYWTSDSEIFFKDCVKYVFDYTTIPPDSINCTKDSDCGTNLFTGSGVCTNGKVFKNFISYDCHNPGETNSFCSSSTSLQLFESCAAGCNNGKCNALTCSSDSDCDDGNILTEDKCVNQGTADSICIHNIYNNITKIRFVSFVAIPSLNSVTLNFSAISEDQAIKGYLLSRDRDKWILVLSPAAGYVFDGLNEGTSYIFYSKAVDINGVNSEEMSISVTTLSSGPVVPPTPSGGGGGGSTSTVSGGFSYCSINWECGSWSECKDGKQTRTCFVPVGKCTPEIAKPIESQSCNIQEKFTSQPSSNEGEAGVNKSSEATNQITGASIAGALGKYSWIGFIIVVLILGIVYYFAKKFEGKN